MDSYRCNMITGYGYQMIVFLAFVPLFIIAYKCKWNSVKKLGIVLLAMYTAFAVGVLFFPIEVIHFGTNQNYLPINYVPFKSIYQVIRNMSFGTCLKEIFGNIIIFIPLGFLIPIVFEKFRNKKRLFLFVLVASCSVEIMQGLIDIITKIPNRIVDIDDVLLNVIGGMAGYLFYFFASKFILCRAR